MATILILFVVCLLGSIIQGITGFGFSILAISILPFFMPLKTAVVANSILALIMTSSIAIKLRHSIDKKAIAIPLAASLVGRSFGMYIFNHFNTDILMRVLGVVLMLTAVWLFYFAGKLTFKPNKGFALAAGLASGILGGMFNIGGPPLVLYYFSTLKDKSKYTATTQAVFALSGFYTVILHFASNNVTEEVLKLSFAGFAAVIIGSTIGLYILKKIDKKSIGKAISLFICVMGLCLLIKK